MKSQNRVPCSLPLVSEQEGLQDQPEAWAGLTSFLKNPGLKLVNCHWVVRWFDEAPKVVVLWEDAEGSQIKNVISSEEQEMRGADVPQSRKQWQKSVHFLNTVGFLKQI